MKLEFTVPIRIESEMNRREHWAKRKKRFDAQRSGVWCARPPGILRCAGRWHASGRQPLAVTLTRIGPRKLDSDNLASGFKAVRDEIARIIGIDDGDSRITWRYDQRKGKPREYSAIIRIEPLTTERTAGRMS
jgi:hypothetical protein